MLHLSRVISLALIFLLAFATNCQKEETGPLYLGTKVCFFTQHHERALTDIEVYLKYGATTFPGYDDLSTFDTMIVSDHFGEACFPLVPLGSHWVVGIGYDSVVQEPVRGSLPFDIISLHHPWDTILYISEY